MITICIVNQKGGCSKTSTAVNLSSIFAEKRYKTLLIDMDPQGNASTSLGIDNYNSPTIYEVLTRKTGLNYAILETGVVNLKIIASNILTAKLEREMSKISGCEEMLSNVLKEYKSVRENYDFCIIDCPPSLGTLSINALVASDYSIIPLRPGIFALEGVNSLMDTIITNKDYTITSVFAPHFGITKKDHNEMAYEAVKLEMETRRNQPNSPGKTLECSMGSP